jgi:ADP-ribosyl-[dinitrogen reductase] hydrolase
MALCLAESLKEKLCFDTHDIGLHYLHWWKNDGYDSGPTAAAVFRLVSAGEKYVDAAEIVHNKSGEMTAGCNPLHRNTVLAMSKRIKTEHLSAVAKEETRLTHFHNIAGETSSSACLLGRYLIEGDSWEVSLEKVSSESSIEIQDTLKKSTQGEISSDGYAPHVLAAAIFFVNNGISFDDTLQKSIEFAGPSNYCPVLVGSLAGARWGASSISDRWLTDVRNLREIKEVSLALASEW